MILPIRAYGDPVLKKKGKEIDKNYPQLSELIDNMFDTMYNAEGVGLAAPQIGLSIRLFIIDTTPFADDEKYKDIEEDLLNFQKAFINPRIIKEDGEKWTFTEGCLSIPNIREDVTRKENITIEYFDENWKKQTLRLSNIIARVVQHEYDHIEGVLFTDHLSSLKKKLLKRKLTDISKGKVEIHYPLRTVKQT